MKGEVRRISRGGVFIKKKDEVVREIQTGEETKRGEERVTLEGRR